jgi:hypothetical protein
MDTIYCAWWNLENLFDTEDAVRTDKLKKAIGKDLVGWTAEILDKKLNQLAKIINKMNDDKGPDIIGVAEVENKEVLIKLKNKLNRNTYAIVHADSKDERGIDVAFIYDHNILETKYFYNLMWELLAKTEGTYYYRCFDLLDQFLISGNIILDKTFLAVDEQSCRIIKIPAMMKNDRPIKFGKPKDKAGVNENGYSDHFPIAVSMNVK